MKLIFAIGFTEKRVKVYLHEVIRHQKDPEFILQIST